MNRPFWLSGSNPHDIPSISSKLSPWHQCCCKHLHRCEQQKEVSDGDNTRSRLVVLVCDCRAVGVGLSGWQLGIYLAMALCVVQIIHVRSLTHDLTAFPVQVRVAYLAMLLAGLWGPLQWIHWMQLVGTSARFLIGYCFLARTLSLAPWNRWQPLTWALLRRTYFSLQANIQPCGEVFLRMSFERVHG